ncbi:MAG: glycosyltransferase family 39 protein [Bacteroidales bacterium]|nr:glycosyltransferase family 39 protein [Bacteroidales bacterium]
MKRGRIWTRPWAQVSLLTLVAAALRVAALPDNPLTYDELSAIRRLGFDTLHDLLAGGVWDDGHPAGVQVFMWLWCRVFGTGAVAVRLPFVLMGLACVPLMYDVGRSWYNHRAGILAATVVAFTQTSVYYSCIARPYIFGLMAILIVLAAWSRMVWRGEKGWWLPVALAFGLALCAYTHYYCALGAALIAVAGLLLVGKELRVKYIESCAAAVLLFAPHLVITWHQFTELQGVTWLGKPSPEWVLQYVRYLNHFSPIVPLALLAALALMCDYDWSRIRRSLPRMAFAAVLLVLPGIVGYVYSVRVSPTLQTSTLIFSLPFLPLVLGGMVGEGRRRPQAAAGVVIYAIALIVTLITTREHYRVCRSSYLYHSVKSVEEAQLLASGRNPLSLIALTPFHLAYYGNSVTTCYDDDYHGLGRTKYDLDTSQAPLVVCSGLDEQQVSLVRRYYPYLVSRRQCTTTDVITLSREPRADTVGWRETTAASAPVTGWSDSVEWLTLFEAPLRRLTDTRFVMVETEVEMSLPKDAETLSGPTLILELLRNGRTVDWREADPAQFAFRTSDSTCVVSIAHLCQLNVKRRSTLGQFTVRVSLHSPDGGSNLRPLRFKVGSYPAGRYMYAIDEEI